MEKTEGFKIYEDTRFKRQSEAERQHSCHDSGL